MAHTILSYFCPTLNAFLNHSITRDMDFRAFEATPGINLIVRPDGPTYTVAAASNDLLRLFNTKRQAVVGKGLFEVLRQLLNALSSVGEANLKTSFEYILEHKMPHEIARQRTDLPDSNGNPTAKQWRILNAPIVDDNDEVLYIVHSRVDITGKRCNCAARV